MSYPLRGLALVTGVSLLSLSYQDGSLVQATEAQTCQWIENTNVCISHEQPECGLYMATSTLGEGANLGMYAGQDFAKDTVIQGEIAIPLMFREFDDPIYWTEVEGGDTGKDDGSLWHRYIWNGWVAEIETYHLNNIQDSRAVFVPGIGCTINSILELRNVQSTTGSGYDTVGVARNDPAAGAFSPYHNSVTTTVVDVPAGSEIFTDYGDEWIPDIPGAQITFDRIMDAAEDFLRDDYLPWIQQHQSALTPELTEALWNFTRDFPHSQPQTFSVLPRNVEWQEIQNTMQDFRVKEINLIKNKLIAKAVINPNSTYEDEPLGPEYTEEASVIRHFVRQLGKRDLTWLQEHGRCSDHMRPGNSTIPHAGRGAFATRPLPRGTIVGYSPLVHVGMYGEDLYNVPYTFEDDPDRNYNTTDLIYNYAFGHADSTILLSPYGSMVNYINHAPAEQANVRVVWPSHEMIAHKPEWLTKDIEFIASTVEKIGLSVDYVALRDIVEGEEILMDYGPEWQAAWDEHVANWVPPPDAEDYVHSSKWPESWLRTAKELANNPYPSNLLTVCIPAYTFDPEQRRYHFMELDKDYIDRVECTVLERHEQEEGEELYTVQLETEDGKTARVFHFPRSYISLTDQVMSQDWHLPNSFRHWIGLPDDIFPETWKNLLDDNERED